MLQTSPNTSHSMTNYRDKMSRYYNIICDLSPNTLYYFPACSVDSLPWIPF